MNPANHRGQSSSQDPSLAGGLSAEHIKYLADRAVPASAAREAKLTSVSKVQAAELLGWKSISSGGLAIPYRVEPAQNDHWRIRLDTPLVRPDAKPQRFASPTGERTRPYLAPVVADEVWQDVGRDLVVVEGPIKALALLSAGILALGLAGVDSGHDPEAWTKGEPKPHPELVQRVVWAERRVILLFDAGRATNLSVFRAEMRLAKCLTAAGARVFVASLPLREDGSDQGPDDFLAGSNVKALRSILDAAVPAGEAHEPLKEISRRLARTDKGKVISSTANATLILSLDPRWSDVLAYDTFALREVVRKPPPWDAEVAPGETPRPGEEWRDADDTRLVVWLEHHWGVKLSDAQAAAVVRVMAQKSPYHPIQEWLRSLHWDGKPRLDTWLVDYFGVVDSRYTRAVGAKWMISTVARAMKPGCEVKYSLILEGPQDLGKSQALRGLFGDAWFTDQISDFGKRDAGHDLWGKWVVEMAELDTLLRAEPSATKAFLSRQVDHFAPRYGRRSLDFPRQASFVGTVNGSIYLKDATGNVRFWPVRCTKADREGTKRDREQLLAEAFERFEAGEHWWLEDGEVIATAREEQAARHVGDAWEDKIAEYIDGKESVSVSEVLSEVFGFRADEMEPRDQNRVAAALDKLKWEGFNKRVGKVDGKTKWQKRYRPIPTTPYHTPTTPENPSGSKEVVTVVTVETKSNSIETSEENVHGVYVEDPSTPPTDHIPTTYFDSEDVW